MRSVEVTIQNLIGSGMDPKTENNPYLGFIYTSFQERATKARAQPIKRLLPCIAVSLCCPGHVWVCRVCREELHIFPP